MTVYPVSAEKATCPVAGCGCAQRAPRYPSDMTDAEWEVLGPQARAVMAELRHGPGGRPMAHRLRVVVDAIRYLVRYGVEWRALPADFPPWQAVYAFFERWAARGLPQRVVDRLRGQLRVGAGRAELPTAAVIDSQSVKAADTVGAATSGFDGGKKIKGRKRHVAVDSNGWLLAVLVTAASVQDRDGGHRLVALLRERFSTITLVWADGGYAGRLVAWAAAVLALTVTVVKRSDNLRGFVVLPRRWVVERTFRLAEPAPAPGPRLRAAARASRGHGAVGHHHDHDTAVGPPAQWGTAPPALGRRTHRAAAAARKIHKRHETVHQQALSVIGTRLESTPGQEAVVGARDTGQTDINPAVALITSFRHAVRVGLAQVRPPPRPPQPYRQTHRAGPVGVLPRP